MKIKDLPKVDRPREEHLGAGHRKRLRERFLRGGLDGFGDYEIVELLLTLGTPRKDCKAIAKVATERFGDLKGVLEALPEELRQIRGLGPHNVFGLKLFQALSTRYAKEKLPKKIALDSSRAVVAFLKEKIGKEKKEHFYMLALDSRNNLLKMSNVSIGTLNTSLVHPREVFKDAIQAIAAKVIIAHNHPSGDPEPSEGDLMITQKLVDAGKILEIEVADHIIVTKNEHVSFRERKLI